jgi:predicted small lipoprotein YifL
MIRNSVANKKSLILAGVLAAAISLAGCGANAPAAEAPAAEQPKTQVTKAPEEKPVTEEKQETEEKKKVNWKECTEEEARELVPNSLVVPEGFKLISWYMLEDGSEEGGNPDIPMVEMEVSKDNLIYDARVQATGDEYLNLSGAKKPEWKEENDERLVAWGDEESQAKSYLADLGDDFYLSLLTWHDKEEGNSYSLHVVVQNPDGIMLAPYAEQFSDKYAALTGKAPEEKTAASNDTAANEAPAPESAKNQGNNGSSDLFYAKDINSVISSLVQDMGLVAVEANAERSEESMFIGGTFIGKYGYNANSSGGYQTYYTFYDLGDCMATNVTFMGWDGISYYDYGTYTIDFVKQSLKEQGQ